MSNSGPAFGARRLLPSKPDGAVAREKRSAPASPASLSKRPRGDKSAEIPTLARARDAGEQAPLSPGKAAEERISESELRKAVARPRRRRLTRTVARYQRIEQVGEGTYGVVYRSRDVVDGKIYALKKIRVHGNANGLPVTALREIQILCHIHHPNMVHMKEIVTGKFGEDASQTIVESKVKGSKKRSDSQKADAASVSDRERSLLQRIGTLYLVMEYVEHDLAGLLDAEYKFSPVQIKAIMKQLLDVLAFLHQKNIVHRDIKCSNLLIGRDWCLKLADFGLARSLNVAEGKQLTNKVITMWYRPPELLLGSCNYTSSVDMWSVGCIFAELLLGRVLFAGKDEADQAHLIFKVLGTPSDYLWPKHRELPLASTLVPSKASQPILRQKYAAKMEQHEGAIDLVERLLNLDPEARTTADMARNQSYFMMQPLQPENPQELGELPRQGLHEYQTKKTRRAARQAAKAERSEKGGKIRSDGK